MFDVVGRRHARLMRAGLLVLCLSGLAAFAVPGFAAGVEPRPIMPRGPLAASEQHTIALFERARDSVVFITTQQQVMDFWTRDVLSVPRGTGSGFVWDEAGHVITNFHVVQGASEALVRLADGRDYQANLVGVSPAHDLAVLKIEVEGVMPRPVPVGTSHDLRVGQTVFAIGNPFGLDWTLTRGIVSALDRSLPGDNGASIEHLIQTDAAINPGNSGGPLLDSAGRLIGINTAIYSPSGASAGIGFSVPVDTINRVVPQIVAHGRYIRPVLGIETDDALNRRLSAYLRLKGVVVLGVAPGSAAASAGLKAAVISRGRGNRPDIALGDVITAIDGRAVDSVGKLLARLDDYAVGDTVTLTVVRNGRERSLRVKLRAGG